MKALKDLTESRWVTRGPSRGRRLGRLFCLPFAGGGSAVYHPWIKRILPDIELVRVNLPGRETRLRETPFNRIVPLVNTLVEELVIWMDRPFAIYGHSMGALVAFELARELRRRDLRAPARLFISAYRAPHLPPSEPPFSHLPDAHFIDCLRQYGGLPDLVAQNEELMEMFLPTLRADFEMTEAYVYKEEAPLECPFTAFGGLSDPKVTRDRILAWKMHTSTHFSSHFFPGGHFFLQNSESLVLNKINLKLAESLLMSCLSFGV